VARIFSIAPLEDFAFWAVAASALGAILAAFHFLRKLSILFRLWIVLGSKYREADECSKIDLQKIRSVTGTQLLLTALRLVAASTAAVALPFSVAEQGFRDKIATPTDLPFWIALVSVVAAIASTIFFFVVEYYVRYNLSPTLGPFVCELFRDEIRTIYDAMADAKLPKSDNNEDTTTVPFEARERETYEYVAREFLHKYRFDTVFAADRFGMILQYLQSGMETCNGHISCTEN